MRLPLLLSTGTITSLVALWPAHVAGQQICTRIVMPDATPPACTTPGSGSVFWVPVCGSVSGPSSVLPGADNEVRTVFIYNRQPSRRLQLNSRERGHDIMIGSPGTSDTISGGGGSNTYVVGNQPARLAVDPTSSTPYVVSSAIETDRLNLVSSGIDYINIKPNGQRSPGAVTTAPNGLRRSIAGSNPPMPQAVHSAYANSGNWKMCPQEATVQLFPNSSPDALLAMGYGSGQASTPTKWMLAQGGEVDRVTMEEELPGVPLVVDFELGKDQIILTDELMEDIASLQSTSPYIYANYSFSPELGESAIIGQSISGRREVPILVVSGVTFSHASKASRLCKKELDCILDTSRGLTNIPTNISPLIYFQDQGLLVSSRLGAKPLGSSGNPGKVIARLMNGNGSALKLPVSPRNPIYKATFITVQPRDPKEQDCGQRKGYSCPFREQKGAPYQSKSGERAVQSAMGPAWP